MRKLSLFLAAAALAAGLWVGLSPSPAGASTIGVCAVDGTNPAAVVLSSNGVKVSRGMGQARCNSVRTTQICVELYGDDAAFDNRLASYCNTSNTGTVLRRFWTAQVGCNEDIGGDELYSRARLRYYLGDGQWTGFSSWDYSATVNVSC
jgi:hypothetical protein